MSRLAGKFAGIVLVTVPDNRLDALVADLEALDAQGLQVTLERTAEPAEPESQLLHLELLGDDHPGIVAEISARSPRSTSASRSSAPTYGTRRCQAGRCSRRTRC